MALLPEGGPEGAPVWQVVAGERQGGILVRACRALSSRMLPGRLSTGALVRELELAGERLRFERLTGSGPASGWVTVRVGGPEGGKALMVRRPGTGATGPAADSHAHVHWSPTSASTVPAPAACAERPFPLPIVVRPGDASSIEGLLALERACFGAEAVERQKWAPLRRWLFQATLPEARTLLDVAVLEGPCMPGFPHGSPWCILASSIAVCYRRLSMVSVVVVVVVTVALAVMVVARARAHACAPACACACTCSSGTISTSLRIYTL